MLSAYMATDMDKMEAVLDNPYILITDKKISNIQEILPVLEQIVQQGRPSADHCRGCRRRGIGNTGCQQAAWYL